MTRYTVTTDLRASMGANGFTCGVLDHDSNGMGVTTAVAYCFYMEVAERIAAALNESEQRAKAKRQREARAYRKYLERDGLDTPDDTPSLANCDDAGTGEGRFHGRM